MTQPIPFRPRTRGFALLVVLFGLVTLTSLYTLATDRALAGVRGNAAAAELALGFESRRSIVLKAAHLMPPDAEVYLADIDGLTVEVRDVAGMVDLNTAARVLLDDFFDALGLSSAEKQAFYSWRAGGRRLLRVEDLRRITGAKVPHPLHRLATVTSGRTGVSPDALTPELQALMGWSTVPIPLQSAPSGRVFAVFVERGGVWRFVGAFVRRDGVVGVLGG